jgi:hypothetical protein
VSIPSHPTRRGPLQIKRKLEGERKRLDALGSKDETLDQEIQDLSEVRTRMVWF